MKNEILTNAVGRIGDDLITEAAQKKPAGRSIFWKFGAAAACMLLCIGALLFIPKLKNTPGESAGGKKPALEMVFEKAYTYSVDTGLYASYQPGKVISPDKVGEKAEDVTVTGGWKWADGSFTDAVTLRAEVYSIKGISEETAVCVKFLDKSESLAADRYYVLINPDADPSPVSDYIRTFRPDVPGENEEIPE